MTEKRPLAQAGEYVRRRYFKERLIVFAVDRNIVLKNEQGTFSVVSPETFNADYVGVSKREALRL